MGKALPLYLRQMPQNFPSGERGVGMTPVQIEILDVTPTEGSILRSYKMRGFSLIEMAMALALILIVSGITFMSLQPSLKAGRLDSGYNLSMMNLRRARQQAVDQRKTYIVTFVPPRTMQVFRQDGAVPPNPAPPPVLTSTYVLPQDVQFRNEPGIPTTPAGTPDGFGIGAFAIDLSVDYGGGFNSVYFRPDGGAYDQVGRSNNGVIYLSRPGELEGSRAISVYGLTGQLHGWRLLKNTTTGVTSWTPQ
jgi:prepilin-type N-terminal cleavage/methylation domain-containing protein